MWSRGSDGFQNQAEVIRAGSHLTRTNGQSSGNVAGQSTSYQQLVPGMEGVFTHRELLTERFFPPLGLGTTDGENPLYTKLGLVGEAHGSSQVSTITETTGDRETLSAYICQPALSCLHSATRQEGRTIG